MTNPIERLHWTPTIFHISKDKSLIYFIFSGLINFNDMSTHLGLFYGTDFIVYSYSKFRGAMGCARTYRIRIISK